MKLQHSFMSFRYIQPQWGSLVEGVNSLGWGALQAWLGHAIRARSSDRVSPQSDRTLLRSSPFSSHFMHLSYFHLSQPPNNPGPIGVIWVLWLAASGLRWVLIYFIILYLLWCFSDALMLGTWQWRPVLAFTEVWMPKFGTRNSIVFQT